MKEKILRVYPAIPKLLEDLQKLLPQNLSEDSLKNPFTATPIKSFLSSKLKGLPPNLAVPHLPNIPKSENDKFAQFDFSNAPSIFQIISQSNLDPSTITEIFDDVFENHVRSKMGWLNLSTPKTSPVSPVFTPGKSNQNPKLSMKDYFQALLK